MSKRAEVQYRAQLLALVDLMGAAVDEDVEPVLDATEAQYAYTADAMGGAFARAIQAAINKAAARFGNIDRWAARVSTEFVSHVAAANGASIASSINNAFGIDIGPIIGATDIAVPLEVATVTNVELIKSIPAQYFDRVRGTVLAGVTTGKRASVIAAGLQDDLGVTKSRAKLIARDQTSKTNAAINEARQTALGIEEYTWLGADDQRERPTHKANNGKTFRWDTPPEVTGHPGHDVNCRCSAIPVIKF